MIGDGDSPVEVLDFHCEGSRGIGGDSSRTVNSTSDVHTAAGIVVRRPLYVAASSRTRHSQCRTDGGMRRDLDRREGQNSTISAKRLEHHGEYCAGLRIMKSE